MYRKIDSVALNHKPYQLTDTERKMLFKRVVTPAGTGTLIDITRRSMEVEINGEKDYYDKHTVSLSQIQFSPVRLEPSGEYQDMWHQACLREAANTWAKKQYIFGEMSLNDYRKHEKEVYGAINA